MLNKFKQYIVTEKRFSEHTCVAYVNDLNQFMMFADINLDTDFKEVESNLIRAWMVNLIENQYVSSSVNNKLNNH